NKSVPVKQAVQSVRGRVIDEQSGEPIIGASVFNNTTKQGIISDNQGRFTLAAAASHTLTISYVGYLTKNVEVPTNGEIIIRMEQDSRLLDEAVVVGYGSQKRVNITGAVSSISGEEI